MGDKQNPIDGVAKAAVDMAVLLARMGAERREELERENKRLREELEKAKKEQKKT